jgi:hypothetical protein
MHPSGPTIIVIWQRVIGWFAIRFAKRRLARDQPHDSTHPLDRQPYLRCLAQIELRMIAIVATESVRRCLALRGDEAAKTLFNVNKTLFNVNASKVLNRYDRSALVRPPQRLSKTAASGMQKGPPNRRAFLQTEAVVRNLWSS